MGEDGKVPELGEGLGSSPQLGRRCGDKSFLFGDAETKRNAASPLAGSATIFTQPRPSCPGMVPPLSGLGPFTPIMNQENVPQASLMARLIEVSLSREL